MDTTTALISFDENGVCNFCHEYEQLAKETVDRPRGIRYKELEDVVTILKEEGKTQQYDCLLGLSGGVDSSYMALVAKDHGLKPLVVHFDNGWNSEIANRNIEGVLRYCDFDLFTYVIDWNEFKDLQMAYIKASVLDIEVPTDQLIFASLFKIAKEKNIKSILSGNNIRTEGILPADWCYENKLDFINLYNINKKFGKNDLKNFPRLRLGDKARYKKQGFKLVSILDKVDFDLKEVTERLIKDTGFKPFPGKHHESIFTRFYQGYILPRKFNVDKRKAHLSSLINSGNISREDALAELKKPTYDLDEQQKDLDYALKKFDLSPEQFDKIMKEKPVPHSVYGDEYSERAKYDFKYRLKMIWKFKILKPLGLAK
ncbi:MAG: N-acetyl sugar amidotransferase [Bacteroidetes bacterium]|nr:N-acetyl sugar amidotransferase [Bacteroidota bacterium]